MLRFISIHRQFQFEDSLAKSLNRRVFHNHNIWCSRGFTGSQEIISIGGAEFDAVFEKLKFFREFGLSNFNKIAVLTHQKWIHKIIDLEGRFFKNFDMKGFSIDDKDKALEFLKSGKN